MDKLIYGVGVLIGLGIVWGAVNLLLRRLASADRGCPRCRKPVVRSHRKPWQRLLSYAIPGLRRYACQSCGWRGLLIHTHID